MRVAGHLPGLLAASLVLAGCGGAAPDGAGASGGAGTGLPAGTTLTVLAAASLTEAFTAIGRDFEQAYPGTRVRFSFASSATVAAQVRGGAPADVVATADEALLAPLLDDGLVVDAIPFAENVITVAVPAANPGAVGGLADLGRPGVMVALCQEQAPCGSAAGEVLRRAGVRVRPVTREPDVKAVLAKVRLGEVDAGMVYVTDVLAAGDDVREVAVPDGLAAPTAYPVAVVADTRRRAAADAFSEFVRSGTGQARLAAAGFRT